MVKINIFSPPVRNGCCNLPKNVTFSRVSDCSFAMNQVKAHFLALPPYSTSFSLSFVFLCFTWTKFHFTVSVSRRDEMTKEILFRRERLKWRLPFRSQEETKPNGFERKTVLRKCQRVCIDGYRVPGTRYRWLSAIKWKELGGLVVGRRCFFPFDRGPGTYEFFELLRIKWLFRIIRFR